jgi:hypothetical protein
VLFKKLFWVNVFESYILCEQMVDNLKVEFKGLCTRYNFVLDFFAYVEEPIQCKGPFAKRLCNELFYLIML